MARSLAENDARRSSSIQSDQKKLLTEDDAYDVTGFAFSPVKKWAVLCSIFLVQLSMNFNASVYGNAIEGLTEEFNVSPWHARLGQVAFLVAYAFGCEAWAPWSEELGRKGVLQSSLLLVNLCQIPCALGNSLSMVIAFRTLAGLSSAGGSVTLGMVADMWQPDEQQYAVNFVVLSSVSGSVLGPLFGCFVQEYAGWRWVFWVSLIFGAVVQVIHIFVPETNTKVLLDREAKRRRATGVEPDALGPLEMKGATFLKRFEWKETVRVMFRPYKFLVTEPIVRWLSLFSGFSDSLIFTGLESFPLILAKWRFSVIDTGLSFSALLVGYVLCWAIYQYLYTRDRAAVRRNPNVFTPEHRLKALLVLGAMLPLGLLGLAFTSLGPPEVHWIGVLLFIVMIGVANYAIYQATIDYMVAAYGPYAASATGGNGFCRDFLAGIAALYSTDFYQRIAPGSRWNLAYPSIILAVIAVGLNVPVWIFYFKGEHFRRKSPYAHQLQEERAEKAGQPARNLRA